MVQIREKIASQQEIMKKIKEMWEMDGNGWKWMEMGHGKERARFLCLFGMVRA